MLLLKCKSHLTVFPVQLFHIDPSKAEAEQHQLGNYIQDQVTLLFCFWFHSQSSRGVCESSQAGQLLQSEVCTGTHAKRCHHRSTWVLYFGRAVFCLRAQLYLYHRCHAKYHDYRAKIYLLPLNYQNCRSRKPSVSSTFSCPSTWLIVDTALHNMWGAFYTMSDLLCQQFLL